MADRFAVNGSGSYLFTWTSPTTGTINTDLGNQSGVTFNLICNSEDRIALVNNLVDDVSVSYGTPPARDQRLWGSAIYSLLR